MKKQTLFAKVRKGDVRVLLGSTAKCGAGTNVQDKLIALHHLDCPWRPADLEQREGRIIRQGNQNDNDDLLVHNISVKDRLDAETGKVVKFISLPSKQADNGQWWSVVKPSNDTVKEAINHYGISAIGKIAVETVGNIKYKDLKEKAPELSFYRHQNVNYGKAVGEELSKAGIMWSGKVEKTGMVITISADENDSYSKIIAEMRERNKAQIAEQAQTAGKVDESAFFDMNAPEPF